MPELLCQDRYDALPDHPYGGKDGSGLCEADLVWLVSASFKRVSRKFRTIAACPLSDSEVREKYKSLSLSVNAARDYYRRAESEFRIRSVPPPIFFSLELAQ